MGRRAHTAADVLRLAASGATELVVAPEDLVTPLARDLAGERGVRVVVRSAATDSLDAARQETPPRLRHVPGVNAMELAPFPVDLHRPEMDVRLADVVTGAHGMPMAAGVMSLRQGSFPWTLDYDEVEYVIEGELHITCGERAVVGRPGDVIAVPKGSSITFGTPSWARFLYVTYPADWAGGA
ncbi:cupin domain-containing protein [Cellulomonas sp. KRMCY2]|uniref:cupin domain-containing protein n=1 Tax=Cellulomonas sp. KRMCY2 TaxID=1304865 RepID=UPI00045EC00A|nr:cupin domain-containing protein [Cellulomonas sp. KRMCY2]